MSFDFDTYNRTKNLFGGPIFTAKLDPLPPIEPYADENGVVSDTAKIAYFVAWGIMLAALGYWFWL